MKKIRFPKKNPITPQNRWESSFGKIVTPLERFVKSETNSGFLLIIFTVIALLIANSPFYHDYEVILASKWKIGTDGFAVELSLHHWINDGLMTLFFFLVGLEIKREILVGELSHFRNALLPICAAIGGMIIPAGIYLSINSSGQSMNGWGVPMATDIAFAVTVLVLLGNKIPKTLMTFLIALAIVDDMGAVLIIALFYSSEVHVISLLLAGGIFVIMMIMGAAGIRQPLAYLIFAGIMWIFIHHSGIHATITGILAALVIPARVRYEPKVFTEGARDLLDQLEQQNENYNVLKNDNMVAILQSLENGVQKSQTPLQRLEHDHHKPVNFLIIPLFALANAAIPIDINSLSDVLTDTVTIGVILGLILGKPLGIFIAVWISLRLGWCQLPAKVTLQHIIGVSFLAGIGFTMSIFVAELAFSDKNLLVNAKTGILFASILAAFIGYIYLRMLGNKNNTGST